MNINEYKKYDAVGLSELIRSKEVHPSEILELAFQQLHKVNSQLNVVSHMNKEKVIKQVEQAVFRNETFAGVPILMKNVSQPVKGYKLTSGSKLLKDFVAQEDSYFVRQFREAGFLFMGHTNTPEFSLKNITESKLYGPTRNPWNPDYSTGGSSGGAAAAVASGVIPVAGASDGGGSIRIPASFTGLIGLKPSRGKTSVGPGSGREWQGASIKFALTRSVRDCAALLDELQVLESHAAFQAPLYTPGYLSTLSDQNGGKLKIAFSTVSPVGTPVTEEAKSAVHKLVQYFEKEGHTVEEQQAPVDGVQLMRNYYLMNSGEMNSVIRNLEKTLGRTLNETDMELESWMLHHAGQYVSAADYTDSLALWDKAAENMAEFHQKYDFYVTPTTASAAPEIGELTHSVESEISYINRMKKAKMDEKQDIIYEMFLPSLAYTPYTQLANLTGQPAISLPIHLTESRMPIGVQIMANKGEDHRLLQLAYQIEQTALWEGMKGNPYFDDMQ